MIESAAPWLVPVMIVLLVTLAATAWHARRGRVTSSADPQRTTVATCNRGGHEGTEPLTRRGSPETPTAAALRTVARDVSVYVVLPALEQRQLRVVLRYDVDDPYAVRAEFHVRPGHQVPWVFARELLSRGAVCPVGEGDVRVRPCELWGARGVCVALASSEGRAVVQMPVADVLAFLRETCRLCRPGTEDTHVDVEGGLRMLLAS